MPLPTKTRLSSFTLIELLVVIAIIAILAAILLPVLDKAKQRGITIQCIDNYKQLQTCYIMYIQDNNDEFPLNFVNDPPQNWILGHAQSDYTTTNIQDGVLFQYNRQVKIYACPANTKMITVTSPPPGSGFVPNELVPQTRTCSINYMMGGNSASLATGPWTETRAITFESYWKLNQLSTASISGLFVFDEEAQATLDDGEFGVYPLVDGTLQVNIWWNLPANRHNDGAVFGFMDGHVERWQWQGPVVPANQNNGTGTAGGDFPGGSSDDLYRVESAAGPYAP